MVKLVATLIRNVLPYDSPRRQKLKSEAEIIGPPGRDFCACGTTGEFVSVHERITQLRVDPACRDFFPDPPKIGSSEEQVREHFDGIVRGEVQVVK